MKVFLCKIVTFLMCVVILAGSFSSLPVGVFAGGLGGDGEANYGENDLSTPGTRYGWRTYGFKAYFALNDDGANFNSANPSSTPGVYDLNTFFYADTGGNPNSLTDGKKWPQWASNQITQNAGAKLASLGKTADEVQSAWVYLQYYACIISIDGNNHIDGYYYGGSWHTTKPTESNLSGLYNDEAVKNNSFPGKNGQTLNFAGGYGSSSYLRVNYTDFLATAYYYETNVEQGDVDRVRGADKQSAWVPDASWVVDKGGLVFIEGSNPPSAPKGGWTSPVPSGWTANGDQTFSEGRNRVIVKYYKSNKKPPVEIYFVDKSNANVGSPIKFTASNATINRTDTVPSGYEFDKARDITVMVSGKSGRNTIRYSSLDNDGKTVSYEYTISNSNFSAGRTVTIEIPVFNKDGESGGKVTARYVDPKGAIVSEKSSPTKGTNVAVTVSISIPSGYTFPDDIDGDVSALPVKMIRAGGQPEASARKATATANSVTFTPNNPQHHYIVEIKLKKESEERNEYTPEFEVPHSGDGHTGPPITMAETSTSTYAIFHNDEYGKELYIPSGTSNKNGTFNNMPVKGTVGAPLYAFTGTCYQVTGGFKEYSVPIVGTYTHIIKDEEDEEALPTFETIEIPLGNVVVRREYSYHVLGSYSYEWYVFQTRRA